MSASQEYLGQNPWSALSTLRKANSKRKGHDRAHAVTFNSSWTSVKDTPYEANVEL